jgi:hypothetical protein
VAATGATVANARIGHRAGTAAAGTTGVAAAGTARPATPVGAHRRPLTGAVTGATTEGETSTAAVRVLALSGHNAGTSAGALRVALACPL